MTNKVRNIMVKASLNVYHNGWNMANPDGRNQALEVAKAEIQALTDAGYQIILAPLNGMEVMMKLDEKLKQLQGRAADGKTSVIQAHVVDHLFGEIERLGEALSIIVAYSKPYHDGQDGTLDRVCLVAIKALAKTTPPTPTHQKGEDNG